VKYGLSGVPSVIDHHPVPAPVQRPFFSDRLRHEKEVTDTLLVPFLHTMNIGQVLLGNDEDMDRRLRVDVLEGKARPVLVDDLCRDLLLDDPAKEAVRSGAHGSLFSFRGKASEETAP